MVSTRGLNGCGKATLPLLVFSWPTPQLRSQREQLSPLQRYPSLHVHSASLVEEHSFKYLNLPRKWKRVAVQVRAQHAGRSAAKARDLCSYTSRAGGFSQKPRSRAALFCQRRFHSRRRDRLTLGVSPRAGEQGAEKSPPVPSHLRQSVQPRSPAALEKVSGGQRRQRPQPAPSTKVPAGRDTGGCRGAALPRGRARCPPARPGAALTRGAVGAARRGGRGPRAQRQRQQSRRQKRPRRPRCRCSHGLGAGVRAGRQAPTLRGRPRRSWCVSRGRWGNSGPAGLSGPPGATPRSAGQRLQPCQRCPAAAAAAPGAPR